MADFALRLKRLKKLPSLAKYADDLLYLLGCALILVGVYQVLPVAVWFAGGAMCLLAGYAIAKGGGLA